MDQRPTTAPVSDQLNDTAITTPLSSDQRTRIRAARDLLNHALDGRLDLRTATAGVLAHLRRARRR